MFEAIHGLAPRMIETGRGAYANPVSLLRAAEMLLRHIARPEKADKLAAAIASCGLTITGREDGATCEQLTDRIIELIG